MITNKRRFFIIGIAPAVISKSISFLKENNFEITICENQIDVHNYESLLSVVDRVIIVNINKYKELRFVLINENSIRKIDGIFSFRENSLLNTALIIEELGLYGIPSKTVRLCIDKLMIRTILKDSGFFNPSYMPYTNIIEAKKFFKAAKGAIVIKPNNLSGSTGVAKVLDENTLEATLRLYEDKFPSSQLMLEEFVNGKEISIEALVIDNEITVFGITEKFLFENTFIESGHITPYKDRDRYKSLVRDIVQSLGIKFAPLHIEGFETAKGFVVGEVHTRYGGDNIPVITELASNCNMVSPVFSHLMNIPYKIRFGEQKYSGIKFFCIKPGVIKKISGFDKICQLDGILEVKCTKAIKLGYKVSPIQSNDDRIGWILAKADTRIKLDKIFESAFKILQIIT